MDAQTVIAIVLGALSVGGAIVGIALYAGKSRDLAEDALHKVRNVESAHHGHIAHVDATYARKDTTAIELRHIRASLERVEQQISTLVERQ